MNTKILEFFNTKYPFNQDGLQEFARSFQLKTYPKGHLLVHQEMVTDRLLFLEQGTVREFYAKDGKEMNTRFYVQPQFINDFFSLTRQTPTQKCLETLRQVQVRELRYDQFSELLKKYTCGHDFINKIFESIIEKKEQESFRHFSLTPDELYLDLLEHHPEWLQEIPLYHIATYLRMTPETLSRIRKRT